MSETPNLKLPYILAAQAQKHVTHNEAIRALDALVQLAVLDRHLATPPASPADGDRYLVAASPTGAWAGEAGRIAAWQDGAWSFLAPRIGWILWVVDEALALAWNGAAWVGIPGAASVNPTPLVGVNATANATNRLAVKSDAVLLSHDDVTPGSGDMRTKVNKSAAAQTASHVFQNGFSGRAELGLTGDDDFHLKVSADGATWREAMVADRATGKVSFPLTPYLSDHAVNLLEDSGRFCTSASWKAITAGTFQAPAYFTLYDGATLTSHGKFIFDNTDYGGAGGTMNAQAKELVDKIRNAGFRRYGVEYFVARLTKGSGTTFSITVSGTTYYLSMFSRQMPRLAAATLTFYIRAQAGNVVLRRDAQTIYLEGVQQAPGHVVITPAMGWQHVRIIDATNPQVTVGYEPLTLSIYQAATSDQALIACPALFGGITDVDRNAGVVPAYNLWSAT